MTDKKLMKDDVELPQQVAIAINRARNSGEYKSQPTQFLPDYWAKVALLAVANEPVVPSKEQADMLYDSWNNDHRELNGDGIVRVIGEWQRRMFLKAPEPLTDEQKGLQLLGKLVNFINEEGPTASAWKAISDATEEAQQLLERLGSAKGGQQ